MVYVQPMLSDGCFGGRESEIPHEMLLVLGQSRCNRKKRETGRELSAEPHRNLEIMVQGSIEVNSTPEIFICSDFQVVL
jgi:hypothetical protein